MRSDATMAVSMLNPFLRVVHRAGRELEARVLARTAPLLVTAGVTRDTLARPDARIPHAAAVALMHLAADVLGNPALGLHAGVALEPDDFGLYGYLMRTAPSLGAFARLAVHYLPLVHDGAEASLVVDTEHAAFEHRVLRGLAAAPAVHEYALAAFVTALRRDALFAGEAAFEVRFRHAAPVHADETARELGVKVRYDCAHNAVIMPRAALECSLRGADPGLHATLSAYGDLLLSQLPTRKPMARRVKALVRERLRDGDQAATALTSVAAALHTSTRSLRRRLEQEGTSHSDLLDQMRRELALDYLAHSELDLSQIAFRLGFAHSPAFHRAFRRWYGMGPGDYRKGLSGTLTQRLFAGGGGGAS